MAREGGTNSLAGEPAGSVRRTTPLPYLPGEASRPLLFRGRLRRQILAWFLVLSLAPLLLSNTVGYVVTHRIISGQVRRFLTTLTDTEAWHVESELERHQLVLDAVVAGNGFLQRSIDPAQAALRTGRSSVATAALQEYLDRKLAELQPLSELMLIDSSGVVVCSTTPARVGADWSRSPLFRQGRVGRFLGEDLEAIGGLVGPVYRLATPILDAGGVSVGVLAATVGFDRVQTFVSIPGQRTRDVRTYIVDSAGRPLFASHPRAGLEYGTPFPSPALQQPAGSAVEYVNYEGVRVLGSAVPIPERSWSYVAEAPVATAFVQLRRLATLAGVLEGTFALFLVAVVWVVARTMVTPLRRLVTAARRIQAGELGVQVQINREDELGDLGRTFDQMSRELEHSSRQITELHEHEMRRAAQLASVGELASGIAHEIKNPLVGVQSGLDLLERQTDHPPKAASYFTQMRAQLQRIDAAIQNLLRYARPKEPRLAWTDPRQLVQRVVELVTPQADAVGVRIETRAQTPIRRVRLDPELVTQALVNLVLNGIQAMEPRGVVTIASEISPGEARITVSDTGAGIAEDQLDTVFRPFYTTKHQGTGLGLAISRGIMERHGGTLRADSRVGAGSTFTLAFPLTEDEPASP